MAIGGRGRPGDRDRCWPASPRQRRHRNTTSPASSWRAVEPHGESVQGEPVAPFTPSVGRFTSGFTPRVFSEGQAFRASTESPSQGGSLQGEPSVQAPQAQSCLAQSVGSARGEQRPRLIRLAPCVTATGNINPIPLRESIEASDQEPCFLP